MKEPVDKDAFAMGEGFYDRNVRTFADMIRKEFGREVGIDLDRLDDGTARVELDGRYVMDVRDRHELALTLKVLYNSLLLAAR